MGLVSALKSRRKNRIRLVAAAVIVLGLALGSPASAANLWTSKPVVTALSPSSGATGGGATVTVTGTGLSGALLVTFGGVPGVVTATSQASVTVKTPPHPAGAVDVRVWALGGLSQVTEATRYTFVELEPVTELAIDQLTTSGATLSWASPLNDAFGGVMIRRAVGWWAPSTPFSGSLAGQTTGQENRWSDTGRERGWTYSYAVFANYGDRGYAQAGQITVTIPAREMLTGTVTGTSGAPVAAVRVTVLDGQGVEASHTATAADGKYAIAGLATGAYTVCFEPAQANVAGLGYLPECWQNVASNGAPTPVSLNPSTTLTGIDAVLATGGAVAGRVTRSDGVPVQDVAISVDDEYGSPLAIVFTDADGRWHASGLNAGRYSVCFDPATAQDAPGYAAQCYPGVAPNASPEVITLPANTVLTGIDAVLRLPVAGPATAPRTAAAGSAAVLETIPSPELRFVPCADVMFLAARGSGEPGPGGDKQRALDPTGGIGPRVLTAYLPFMDSLTPQRVVTPPISVFYPAEPVSKLMKPRTVGMYFAGLDMGVLHARLALSLRAEQCPAERFVIAGYSQGAMVMHRVLHNRPSPGSGLLSQDVLNRIDAAILIADGDQISHDTTDRAYSTAKDSAESIGKKSSLISGTVNARLPQPIGRKTISVCDSGDIVCDTSLNIIGGTFIHIRHYTNAHNVIESGQRAAQLALQYRPLAPVITTTSLPSGTSGAAYSERLVTGDGRLGTWAVVAGSLPEGLVLTQASPFTNALVNGRPTTAGASTFTLRFTDHYGLNATAELTLTVEAPSPPDPPASMPDSLADLPLPGDAASGQRAEFETASCGPSVCVAAGRYTTTGGDAQEALWLWANGAWTAIQAPMPQDSTGATVKAELSSCGADTCAIWGRYDGAQEDTQVAWTWSGSWTGEKVTPPDVGQPTSAYIDTLSCGSGVCAASGLYHDPDDNRRTVLWAWSGSAWASTSPPLPANSDQEYVLYMSCGTGICAAAGVTNQPLSVYSAWSWSDGTWSLAPNYLPPQAGTPTNLVIWDTACHGGTCFVTGAYDDAEGINQGSLAQYTDGGWSAVTLPVPSGSPALQQMYVTDISCGHEQCAAYGVYADEDSAFHETWWSFTANSWTAAQMHDISPVFLSCGSGICAAASDSAFWIQRGSSPPELVAIPDGATMTSVPHPACGTETCGFAGTYADITGTPREAMWLWSDGTWSRGELPQPANSHNVNIGTFTCGAGHCLVGATYEDDSGQHRQWWSWSGSDLP